MFERITEPEGRKRFVFTPEVWRRMAIMICVAAAALAITLVFYPDWKPGPQGRLVINAFQVGYTIFSIRWIFGAGQQPAKRS
jgi:hypothetical protein